MDKQGGDTSSDCPDAVPNAKPLRELEGENCCCQRGFDQGADD
jgi:hypothetical protein